MSDNTYNLADIETYGDGVKTEVEGAIKTIEADSNSYATMVSETWRDENAQSFMVEFKTDIGSIVSGIKSNYAIYKGVYDKIAASFFEQANSEDSYTMAELDETSFTGLTFGVDGNEYLKFDDGSKGIRRSVHTPSDLTTSFDTLSETIKSKVTSVKNAMTGTPYGNQTITDNLSESLSKLVGIASRYLESLATSVSAVNTAEDTGYSAVDSAAVSASEISEGSSGE